jgi:hypothetical protein
MPLALLLGLLACDSETDIKQAEPNLTVTPAVLDFGGIVVDYTAELPLRLLNGGLGRLEVTGLDVLEDPAGVFSVADPLPGALASDAESDVRVRFSPLELTDYTATLSLSSNDADGPHTIVLTGAGVEAPRPDVALDTQVLDFGTVAPGDTDVAWFNLSNEGDHPLTLGRTEQSGSGAFTLPATLDGYVIPPGQAQQVLVLYAPTAATGDHGALVIPSDDPDEPEVRVTFLGNGGGDYDYPVAVIDGPDEVAPRDTVTLDGSGSSDPAGGSLTYHWALESAPDGSDAAAHLVTATDRAYLQTDLAGTYDVTLQVETAQGLRSAPARHRITAIPEEQIHIELTWDTGAADLDLHLLDGDGAFFTPPGDCTWCNRNPSWGGIGTEDDPSLDIDDLSGYGPENVNVRVPADDTYRVLVHYFQDNGDGDVVATVRVYVRGVEAGRYVHVLRRNQVWEAARIEWPSGVVLAGLDAPTTATRRNCN